jgi:hypothetical protein
MRPRVLIAASSPQLHVCGVQICHASAFAAVDNLQRNLLESKQAIPPRLVLAGFGGCGASLAVMMDRSIEPRLLRLHKMEAAKRQIESAIWLWFVDADMVSVHTLTAAAQRLLLELAELWGVTAFPFTAAYHPPHSKTEERATAPDAETFFKAGKDEETYELSEAWTEVYLLDAVMSYCNIMDNLYGSAMMATFVVRFAVQREDLFARGAFSLLEKTISKDFNLERLQELSKIEFLKEFFGFLHRPTG